MNAPRPPIQLLIGLKLLLEDLRYWAKDTARVADLDAAVARIDEALINYEPDYVHD